MNCWYSSAGPAGGPVDAKANSAVGLVVALNVVLGLRYNRNVEDIFSAYTLNIEISGLVGGVL